MLPAARALKAGNEDMGCVWHTYDNANHDKQLLGGQEWDNYGSPYCTTDIVSVKIYFP